MARPIKIIKAALLQPAAANGFPMPGGPSAERWAAYGEGDASGVQKYEDVLSLIQENLDDGTLSVAGSTDIRAKVSATDTTTDYLQEKIAAGSNITITKLNSGGDEQLQIAATGGGHTIEDEGTPLTQRSTLNFVGAGVTATDAGGKTVVTIPGGGGGSAYDVYSLGNGGYVVADGSGVTFSKNATTGEYTFDIPDGVDVKGGWVSGIGTADGDASNNCFFIFNYAGAPIWNQSVDTARMINFRIQNANGTPNRTSPHAQDNTLTFGMSAVGSGSIEYKLNNATAFFLTCSIGFWIA